MQKTFDWLVAAFVFLSAMFYIPGMTFFAAQEGMFKFGVTTLFIISLYMDPVRKVKNAWLNAFLGAALASILLAKAHREIMIEPFVNIFLTIVLFYLITNYMKDRKLIYTAIGGVVIATSLLSLLTFFKINTMTLPCDSLDVYWAIGTFGHPFNTGMFAACAMGVVAWPLGILAMALAFLSNSWLGVGMALAVFAVYMLTRIRRIGVYLTIVLIILASVLGFRYIHRIKGSIMSHMTPRTPVYSAVLKAGMNSGNVVGYGLGSWPYISAQAEYPQGAAPPAGMSYDSWNDYLKIFVELGYVGLFIMLGLFWKVVKDFTRMKKDRESVMIFASLATIPIGCFFHSYFDYTNTGVICLALLAVFYIKREEQN